MLRLRGDDARPASLYHVTPPADSSAETPFEPESLYRAQILHNWGVARQQLARATQAYLAASAAVESDCSRPSVSLLDQRTLEDTLVNIHDELGSLVADEQRLWRTRIILQGLRNKSSVLSPINLLPPEVLTDIFVIAVDADRANRAAWTRKAREAGETKSTPTRLRRPDLATVISSVSIYWRRLAVRTRALWAHIDCGEGGARTNPPFAQAKLWLHRASGAPLYISIKTTDRASEIFDAWAILPLLITHEAHFRSLDLELNQIDEVHAALARWLNDGAPDSLRSLAVSVPPVQQGDTPYALPPGLVGREQRDAFFGPIRSLDLNGTYLGWGGAAFRGLVDLRLSRLTDRVCPNVEQIFGILSGSPALRTLWLRRMTIRVGARMNFAPVKMTNLEILGLEHIEPQGLCLLLPLLAPELPIFVKLAAYTRDPGEVGEALTDLFARSKVETLHLSTFINPAQLPRMLARLQHLRAFTWYGLNIGDEFFEAMAHDSMSANNNSNTPEASAPSYLCSSLNKLELQQCSLSAEALRKMVTNRSIPRLSIVGCHLVVDGTGEEAPQLMEEFERCLNSSVRDVLLSDNSLVVQD